LLRVPLVRIIKRDDNELGKAHSTTLKGLNRHLYL
jgi:hypothetical protein